jgi:hypothetical protein
MRIWQDVGKFEISILTSTDGGRSRLHFGGTSLWFVRESDTGVGMNRWLKRLWLRYIFYFKEHWIIAASLTLTILWALLSLIIQVVPAIVELAIVAL